jgi:acetoacetyl-CoA reductase
MDGRVAVVTGGTGIIGTEICRLLAARGDRVVALYRPAATDCQIEDWKTDRWREGLKMRTLVCDVTDFGHTSAVFEDIERQLGPIEVLVNAAGIDQDAVLRQMTLEAWQAVLRANLDGVFNTTRCVIDGMLSRGFGRIINIAPVSGRKGQAAGTKGGVHGFTLSIAHEVARKGITVNTVSPGYAKPPTVSNAAGGHRSDILAGRFGIPSEVAKLVAFLAAGNSGFITGADLSINGGRYMG